MAILKVQDANQHEFTCDSDKLFRIYGDVAEDAANGAGIMDSMQKHRVTKVHDVEFVNSKGEVIDAEKLLKDSQSGKTNITALDVEMEATHSGDNHNYCIYYEDSMEKDCESFVNPFHKPVLKNHNSYNGEPLGRILQAWHGPSKLTDERTAIHLKTRITDKEAIPKFLDGRYGTVSISGTMGTVICNVCGKTILKDGKFNFCGHWRGETYKDKVCYWGAKDIEYHEVSTVNTPADDYAQIMKVTVLTDADEDNNKEEHDMAGVPSNNTSAADAIAKAKAAVNDIIDQMLGNSAPPQTQDSATPTNKEAETAPTATDNTGTGGSDSDKGDPDPDAAKDDRIKQLEQQLTDAKNELTKTQTELQEAKDNLEKTQKDLEATQTECDSYKEKCMTLATSNKELVVDSILAKENIASDKVEDRKAELMGKSMKELTELSTKDSGKPDRRQPAQVNDPTLGVEQKDARGNNSDSADVKDSADTKKTRKTVDDFAKEIVGKLSH